MAPVKQILEGAKKRTSKIFSSEIMYGSNCGESDNVGTGLCVFVVGEGRRRVKSSID